MDGDLDLPDIALFSDDNLISEADARTPVHVKIPEIPKAAAGDEVIFYLGTSSTSRLRINTADLGNPFVLEFDLPYAFVANGGGTGAPQQYSVQRTGVLRNLPWPCKNGHFGTQPRAGGYHHTRRP